MHAQRTRLSNTTVEWRPNSWQADTVFIKRRGRPIAVLCCVEVTTRKAWAHTYNSAVPMANKTVELLKLAEQEGNAIDHLSTDPGSEFTGAALGQYLRPRGVTLHFFAAGDKRSKGIVESFNRTLRLLLAQWVYDTGNPNWDQGAIDACVAVYNARKHSATGYAPNDVTPEIAAELRQAAWDEGAPFREHFNQVAAPGNRVRVAASADPEKTRAELKAFNLTRKAGEYRWTARVYTVKDTKGWRVRLEEVPRKLFNVRDLIPAIGDGEQTDAAEDTVAKEEGRKAKQERRLRKEGLHPPSASAGGIRGGDLLALITLIHHLVRP